MSTSLAAPRTSANVSRPNQAVWQSHPDHLASIARMFGLRPQPVDRCRVLELGCGPGRNLLPMAERHPQSQFVGVDSTASQIVAARQAVSTVGFENIEFRNVKLGELDDGLGTFDYIICHDLFGRIAPELQDLLLEACRARLNPQGVVYLGYRSLPGWIPPSILREIMRTGVVPYQPIQKEIADARGLLKLVCQSLASDASPYARLLEAEASLAQSLSDELLISEYLGAESHPIYLQQLAAQAASHELQYLGDAEISTMFAERLSPLVQQRLAQVAHDDIATQQLMDVLTNRSYRHSLLCHANVPVQRRWSPTGLSQLYLAGALRPQDPTAPPTADAPARFVTSNGSVISATLPAAKVAFAHLGQIWPRAISFDELLQAVREQLAAQDTPPRAVEPRERDELGTNLIECLANGFVQAYSEPDPFVTTVSERPRSGRWAQVEAKSGLPITNLRHKPVVLDDMSRNLLGYLDGRHDRKELSAIVVEAADKGQLSILRGGIPTTQGPAAAEILNQVLDQSLAKLVHHQLLVA